MLLANSMKMLCAGYTQIRKANYASRGVYFQAFTSLSTGLERICKICYLLIYAIENDGQFPTNEYLKKTIGHDIGKLYGEIIRFKKAHAIQYDFLQDLDEPIYQKMLEVLSRFGKGDRYANIDFLTGSISYEDPISVWYRDVDMVIFKEKVSNKKKEKLWKNAYLIHQLAY